ncbi:MAG: tricorn protease interacting factor [Actinomycetota bacterium]|nr:tricorn protease interacting factor [Actinomycetota bacterium]
MGSPSKSRLPRAVRPGRYDLIIEPDLEASAFTGSVAIEVTVDEPTREIVLNTRDLDITVAEVEQNGARFDATVTVDGAEERAHIGLPGELGIGGATLRCSFTGKLHDDLVGFYRSRYTGDDGAEHTIAATQFEATHARRAFPCFDEPDFKAVFATTLIVDGNMLALSNTAEIGRERARDNKVRVRFADTMPMSTYLVAFVVGPLEVTAPVDARGIPVRVAHAPGKAHLTGWPIEVASFALAHFSDYYGIPYPGDKLDLVALPDFAFGAMENLGCVTFRESLLLADPDHATQAELAQASLTIVHEIAHMWFGDLVTMKWWNGIWLNEAFATFMEHAGVDAFRPEWRTWDDFSVGRTGALEVDALASTRPVEYEVHSPEDADGMFDVLTYQKGGSVVRMLEQYLGEGAFRSGVQQYLERYRFGNTETTDLWDALENATGRPARRIMDSWIFQPGFPLINVAVDGRTAELTQQRFSYSAQLNGTRWSVPVIARASVGGQVVEQRVLLEDDRARVEFDGDIEWLLANVGAHGFYRVAYPPGGSEALLATGSLTPVERYTLVDDLFAAMLAGKASAAEFVTFCRSFSGERDLIVWRVIVGRLRFLLRFIEPGDRGRFGAIVAELVRPAARELTWEPRAGESGRDRELRAVVLDALGTLADDQETIARAREVHAQALAGSGDVDADVVAACISIVSHHGTDDDFDTFVERYKRAATPQEQLRYLYSLGQFPTEPLVHRALVLATSDEVRTQNAPFLLQRAIRNRDHGPYAWAFVRDNWDALVERFPPNLVVRMVEGVQWLLDDAVARDVEQFLDAHPFAQGERTIRQHVERLQVNVAARQREAAGLAAAL